jgi:hypothetical protein
LIHLQNKSGAHSQKVFAAFVYVEVYISVGIAEAMKPTRRATSAKRTLCGQATRINDAVLVGRTTL